MSFREELAALVAGHLRGVAEGKELEDARSGIEADLRNEADRQVWLGCLERFNAEGFEFFQLTADLLNPKPDGRKASAYRREQLWGQGALFVGKGTKIGEINPTEERFVIAEAVPADIAEAIYQSSRKLTMAEAIEQHDGQKAVVRAASEELRLKWNEEAEAEEDEERKTQEALEILERMKWQ